jgi:hypothetical protein
MVGNLDIAALDDDIRPGVPRSVELVVQLRLGCVLN